jgi:hypothetical protein
MLAFFIAELAVGLSFIMNQDAYAVTRLPAYYVAAGAALAGCVTILLMPLREPSVPIYDIAAVGQPSSIDFRSPEDNLRLWQFLSVSWMAPLITIGKKRQLDEDDVWFLGFEFQHRRLHEKFRRLKGSVVGRLLRANGIDLVIVSTIAIVMMICGLEFPCILQRYSLI